MHETEAKIGRLFLADLHTAETWLSGSPQDLKRAVRSYDRYLIYQDNRETAPPERYHQFLSCLKQCVFVEATAMTPKEKEAHMLSKIFEWTSTQSFICFLAMGETGERLALQITDREAVTSLTFRMGKFKREAAFKVLEDGKEKTDPAVFAKSKEEENAAKQKAEQETEKEPAASVPQAQTVESEGLPFAVVAAYEEPAAPKKKKRRRKKKTSGPGPEKKPEEHRESLNEPVQAEKETGAFVSASEGQQKTGSERETVVAAQSMQMPSEPEEAESGHMKTEVTDQKLSKPPDRTEVPERTPALFDVQENTEAEVVSAEAEAETLSDKAKPEEISVEGKVEVSAGPKPEETSSASVTKEETIPQEQIQKQTEEEAEEGEEPGTSEPQKEAAEPVPEQRTQEENGTKDTGPKEKKAGWKERISSKTPRTKEYELQNLEDMIFAEDRAAVRREEPVPELVDTKAKTVSLYADRLIASIDRLLPKLAKRNVSREHYMEFISELVMSERVEDFQNGMAKLFSGFSVSIDAEIYQQLRKQALHYAKTCQVLYGDDVWGI